MTELEEAARQEGVKDGRKEGIQIGRKLAILDCIIVLVRNLKVSPESAMALLEVPRKDRNSYLRQVQDREQKKGASKNAKNFNPNTKNT